MKKNIVIIALLVFFSMSGCKMNGDSALEDTQLQATSINVDRTENTDIASSETIDSSPKEDAQEEDKKSTSTETIEANPNEDQIEAGSDTMVISTEDKENDTEFESIQIEENMEFELEDDMDFVLH